jgi:hypothetical protein
MPSTRRGKGKAKSAQRIPEIDGFASHDDWMAQTAPPLLYQPPNDARVAAQLERLDTLPGIKSPTPGRAASAEVDIFATTDEEESEQLALGFSLSMSNIAAHNADVYPAASTSSISQILDLRSLSPSPDLPASIPLPSPPPPPSHRALTTTSKTVKPLRITTQLNADWMGTSSATQPKKKAPSRSFVVVYWDEVSLF